MTHEVKCGRCGFRQDVPKEGKDQPDMPEGWSVMSLAVRGDVTLNSRLCLYCTRLIKKEIGR